MHRPDDMAIVGRAAQDDILARHLRNTIRTGRLCGYQPEEAVSWRTWQCQPGTDAPMSCPAALAQRTGCDGGTCASG